MIGFHTRSGSLTANDLIIGIGVALLAYGFGTAYERTHGLSWVAPLFGVWLIIAPWVVHGVHRTNGLLISNIVIGACIVVLGLAAFTMGTMRVRR